MIPSRPSFARVLNTVAVAIEPHAVANLDGRGVTGCYNVAQASGFAESPGVILVIYHKLTGLHYLHRGHCYLISLPARGQIDAVIGGADRVHSG